MLITNNIPNYTKQDIDCGETPKLVVKVCLSLKAAFFLSYKIRKNVNFFIYIVKRRVLLKYEGLSLKYLGPDERSQSLLLEKALNEAMKLSQNSPLIKSTPGITLKQRDLTEFLADFQCPIILNSSKSINIENNELFTDIGEFDGIETPLFIYFLNYKNSEIFSIFNKTQRYLFLRKKNERERVFSCADTILYINHYYDLRENDS